MTDAPDPVTTGQPVTYTLMIRNNGARSAKGVTLTDDLPAGVTRGAVTTTQGSCGGTDPVRCNLGRIASGAQATVTVSVTPTAPGTITNQAWVAAKKNDPNAGNNSVSTATTVVDVTRTTPLGLENPLSAGCEFVNEEIACPEMASSSSISFDVDIPAGASFIEFDYAFSGADEGDYGTVHLDDVPAAVSRADTPERPARKRSTEQRAFRFREPYRRAVTLEHPAWRWLSRLRAYSVVHLPDRAQGHDDDVQPSGRSARLYISPSAFPHRIRMSGKMFRQACHDLRH